MSKKTIRKAIITTAGFGTRFLPISKTIQKEMLPILDRPLVDYVVADLVAAGIEEIIFVVSEHNRQILHYYSNNPRLTKYLQNKGKTNLIEQVQDIHSQATFTFIKQPDAEQYGTAIPVKLCREHVEHEDAFMVMMGDDFLYAPQGKSVAAQMIALFHRAVETDSTTGGVMTCIERPDDELHKYGIAALRETDAIAYLTDLVEKPEPGTAPSNLSNVSKYIFTPDIFPIIEQQKLDPKSGELYVTDSVLQLSQKHPVAVLTPDAEYLDGGNVVGWLKANLRVAADHPEVAGELREYLREVGL